MYSDLQASEGRDGEKLRANPAIPLQRWRVDRFYADLAQLYQQHDCQYLIDLGDTTDDRKALPVPTINSVMGGLNRIRPNPALSIKLIGNHEQAYRDAAQHPGLAYSAYHRVVDTFDVIYTGRTAIVCVAWPNNEEETAQWLYRTMNRLHGKYQILLLGHLHVEGALINGRKAGTGHAWEMDIGGSLTLLGHVHQPQQIVHETAGSRAYYVGSPFQQDYGEMNQAKRVGLVDLDTLELTWLSLPSAYPRYLRISMDEFESYSSVGEDRITVTLRSTAEAARFHSHPLSATVDADYQLAPVRSVTQEVTLAAPDDVLAEFVTQRPLDGFTSEELLAIGRELTGLGAR